MLNVHPAANAFPLFDEKRLAELAEDIQANGQREPIRLYRGAVLDGRNRLAACQLAGIEPRTEAVSDDIDPWSYVWSLNGERRDLTADQRYLIWKDCHEQSEAWAAEAARIKREADRKRGEAMTGVAFAPKGESRKPEKVVPQVVGTPSLKPANDTGDRNKTTSAKAKASKTNRGSVERMDKLADERPDLAAKVKTGELPAAAAIREMKRDTVVQQLEDVATVEAKRASGVYDVVVIDPPWQMEKIERDERPNQVEFDYPTMGEAELIEFGETVRAMLADDCHAFIWTTHKHLPLALRLLEGWGLKYTLTMVWHKPGGFQPVGLPQYNCEFAIYARKGSPKFIDTKAFPVCFEAPRRQHSRKPDEFYDVIRRVTAGRRIDVFSREAREGFDQFGNESDKFSRAA